MDANWRVTIESGGGDIHHQSRSTRPLIQREDERLEAESAQKQAIKQKTKATQLQAPPSVS
jgi:hypothetical protein